MKTFVCRICSEVYIGKDIPGSCPFCGVSNKYFRLAHVWQDENDVDLVSVDKNNVEAALKLELSNSAFYKCVSKNAEDLETRLVFKGLFKIEKEHAEVYTKLLKIEMPEIEEMECEISSEEAFKDSLEREKRAVDFYAKAAAESVNPRVKEVFEAILEAEKDHIELDEGKLG